MRAHLGRHRPGPACPAHALNDRGCASLQHYLTPDECSDIAGLYDDDRPITAASLSWRGMASAVGEYKYFSYPLPEIITALRPALYERLAPIAQCLERGRWQSRSAIRPIT